MKSVGQIYRENLMSRIKDNLQEQETVLLMSLSGLNANRVNEFRKSLHNAGAQSFVSKNSIAAIALKDLKHDKLAQRVSGQTMFVWGAADSVEISKLVVKFTEEIDTANICGGILDGRLLEQQDVKRLSDLPSREVLLAQLLGTIQAPVTRLLGAFNAKTRDLLSILKQLSEREGGSE